MKGKQLYRIILLLVISMLPMMSWGLSFKHYTGYAGDGTFNWNVTQKCHEQVYYYYVTKGQTINLDLPFVNYEYEGDTFDLQGQNAEPRAYFRWYNWAQDGLREGYNRLSIYGSQLGTFEDHAGFYYYYNSKNKLSGKGPYRGNIGVKFQAPSTDAEYEAWTADTIACDVSRYCEFELQDNDNTLREPTLSIRYKFIIRKAEWLANQLRDAVVNNTNNTRTFEDGKYVTVGINKTSSGKSEAIFRLNYPAMNRYFFYPLTSTAWNTKNIFYDETNAAEKTKNKFEDNDFESDLVQADGCSWVVYDDSYQYYCTVPSESGKPFFCKISPYILNNRMWSKVSDRQTIGKPSANGDVKLFTANSKFYIVAYLSKGTGSAGKYCPVANFTCRYVTDYPRLYSDLEANAPMRTLDYIGNHFAQATDPISFDNSSSDMTLDQPTFDNNMAMKPSRWDLRHYGFVYRALNEYLCGSDYGGGIDANKWGAPLHGEYGLYKTAGVSNISQTSTDVKQPYRWYWGDPDKILNFYDRTYALTGGTQSGYFFYVDASDESRPIASADFDAKLCTGSTLVISAAVADLTMQGNAQIKPQLEFKLYGIDEDGEVKQENLVHSFATGDFRTMDATEYGKWYQVYAKVILRKGANVERFSKFKVTIDNYCPGTNGADYAIDDIRLYKADAIVNVIQQQPLCSDAGAANGMSLKLRASYESLLAKASEGDGVADKIYYRFIDENGKPLSIDYGNGDKKYGEVAFPASIKACSKDQIEHIVNEDYFVIANQSFALEADKNYYVVLAFGNPDTESSWGSSLNVCSAYSEKFSLVRQGIVIKDNNSKVMASYRVGCNDEQANISLKAELQTTDQVLGGSVNIPSVPFDWFFGSKEQFFKANLLEALHKLRSINQDKISDPATITNLKNAGKLEATYADSIVKYMNANMLSLVRNSTCPAHTFEVGKNSITILPVVNGQNQLTVQGITYSICPDAMEYSFSIYKDGPRLDLGFYNVTYPSEQRVLRLGLPQLEDMGATGYMYLPINKTRSISTTAGNKATFQFNVQGHDRRVTLTGSDDPAVQNKIGNQYFLLQTESLAHVDKETEQRYLCLQLADRSYVEDLFHEGYSYDFTFEFTQESSDGQYVSCPGTTDFTIKVVPEYLTWTPTADGGNNNNWNNDLNWRRSSRTDLYKGEEYPIYGETEGYQDLTVQQAFVPMKFSKVTLLGPQYTIGYYPTMGYLQKGDDGLLNKLTNGSYTATENILYDMMLDDSPESMPSDVEKNDGNYGCVPFYGNTCDQLYFKPEAELRNQQYLIYNKVWVEKELNLRQRYILGTPLRETYSGDMYVPTSNGRQETEAFVDITYDASKNDRSKYPFIQKGWEDSSAKEVTADGTTWKAYDYAGTQVQMPDDISWSAINWTHAYNDVAVKYSPSFAAGGKTFESLKGFSIQAGDKHEPANAGSDKVLVRLPKADKEYAYYEEDGKQNNPQEIVRTDDNYKLIIASANPTDKVNENAVAPVTVQLVDKDQQASTGGYYYYLTYNPYMATLDMKSFFAANKGELGEGNTSYWVVKDGTTESGNTLALAGETDGRIAPMEAFFLKSATQNPTIHFNSNMTVDKTVNRGVTPQAEASNTRVELDVQSSAGSSKSYVVLNAKSSADYDEAEDTELLYDNSGSNIPTLYTVAGEQAVAVNTVPEVNWMPMGIISDDQAQSSVETHGMATLAAKGVSKLNAPLYLYDAATKQYQEVKEGENLNIAVNEHGRYFLTQTRGTTGIEETVKADESVKIYSPSAGLIVVSSPASILNKVEVYTLEGKLVASKRLDDVTSFNLRVPSACYVVKVQTATKQTAITRKLSVR